MSIVIPVGAAGVSHERRRHDNIHVNCVARCVACCRPLKFCAAAPMRIKAGKYK